MKKTGILVLENGDTFYGESFAFKGISFGEVVFNTSMTGYQEILTDPSYKRQIITLTYPEIGNYGIVKRESQSEKIHAHGLLIKNYNHSYNNPASNDNLKDFLKKKKIIALKNLDTRRLTKILRDQGSMEGAISSKTLKKDHLLNLLKKQPRFHTFDLASEVSTKKSYWYHREKEEKYRIGVLDFGVKKNILNLLSKNQSSVLVLPITTSKEEIFANRLDGLLLSNGPGDPNALNEEIVIKVKSLIGKIPIFGICFGHQILLKALGKTVYKLKFGHHGANHPIKNFSTQRTTISSQNHGYAIKKTADIKDLQKETNLNDETLAGFFNEGLKCFSVQYHPEGAPGPEDNYHHFNHFIRLVKNHASK